MFGVQVGRRYVPITLPFGGRLMKMKEGWEGLTVALWMLLIAWILIAIIKFLF